MSLAWWKTAQNGWRRKEQKKKTETSLMLLVAVNKFQPKTFLQRKKRRKQRAKLREKSEMCVKKRFFFLWLLTASFAVVGSTGNGDEN